MTLNVLVFGRTGQVGSALASRSDGNLSIQAVGRETADLSDPVACAAVINRLKPDIVINAAAYTAVDSAESDDVTAMTVNARAPGMMAEATRKLRVPFLHVSTDYVFSGNGVQPWRENDPPAPINVYGATKRIGEQAVIGANPDAIILRTSWVFNADGQNFVNAMLRAALTRDQLSVVDDQFGSPTPADAIADALLRIARRYSTGRGAPGLYHYCGAPATSWYGFAQEIFRHSGHPKPEILPIPTSKWPCPAARPRFSVLDCSRILDVFGLEQPDWRTALERMVSESRTEAA